jgi:hypothetical protein
MLKKKMLKRSPKINIGKNEVASECDELHSSVIS